MSRKRESARLRAAAEAAAAKQTRLKRSRQLPSSAQSKVSQVSLNGPPRRDGARRSTGAPLPPPGPAPAAAQARSADARGLPPLRAAGRAQWPSMCRSRASAGAAAPMLPPPALPAPPTAAVAHIFAPRRRARAQMAFHARGCCRWDAAGRASGGGRGVINGTYDRTYAGTSVGRQARRIGAKATVFRSTKARKRVFTLLIAPCAPPPAPWG